MVLESGLLQEREDHYELTGPLPPLAIPATLHDSLMARLDRLATVKAWRNSGRRWGASFAYALLQAVSPWDEATLQRGLQQLVEAEFLYQRGLPPQATYIFKHALIQDAAYQSLLKSTRQQYHQRIAQVLEAQLSRDSARPSPNCWPITIRRPASGAGRPLLAAGRPARHRALGPCRSDQSPHQRAGGAQDAPGHARAHPAGTGLADRPGPALIATKGYAAPEVEQTYARARELCQQVGETPQLFPVLQGCGRFMSRGRSSRRRGAGGAAPRPGPAVSKTPPPFGGPQGAGQPRSGGEFAAARAHLEQGMALYDPSSIAPWPSLYGQDPGVCACPLPPGPCGCLAIRTRPCSGVTRR